MRKAFMDKTYEKLVKYLEENVDPERKQKVVEWMDPGKLRTTFDMKLQEDPEGFDSVLDDVDKVLKHSVRTGHPRFMNMLYSGAEEIGITGEFITAACNTAMPTYEIAPVFSIMERTTLEHMRSKIGFPKDGDGVMTPGGSIGNLYAMMAARHYQFPHIKAEGLRPEDKLVAFTSELSHYSIKRAASVLGIGTNNCWTIPTDDVGRIIPSELDRLLEKAKAEGKKPFFVAATACTTVEAAFDPIEETGEICRKHGVWFHVDAAWGGGVLVSNKHKHLMKGVEKADSCLWNPHKMLGLPQQCSCINFRRPDMLAPAMSMGAKYLFHDHDVDDSLPQMYDTGDKTLQCGRRVDVLKLWLAWRVYGDQGYERRINLAFDNAKYFADLIRSRPGRFALRSEPQSVNVCFWYIPPSIRDLEPGQERDQRLHQSTKKIRDVLLREGNVLVNIFSEFPAFWRMVVNNSNVEHRDLEFVLGEIERIGEDLDKAGVL